MAAELTLELQPIKTFHFTWTDVADATHYKLLENADGTSEFIQVGDNVAAAEQAIDHIVPLYARVNAKYILQTCNANACIDSDPVEVTGTLQEAIGYVKASNTNAYDSFGWAVAFSADGNTFAVGARGEASGGPSAGAVYIFTREEDVWSQQEYLKASNRQTDDRFGISLALSADGSTLAVGAEAEASNARGIGGDQSDNSALFAGAVYLFSRLGSSWEQQAYVKASNTDAYDVFGTSVALSADGNTLAVGAILESSIATGIGGAENSDSTSGAGGVYVFSRSGSSWGQQAYVKASNSGVDDFFGRSVALSDDGTLAVGADGEDSASGLGGNVNDNSVAEAGAVYLY